MEPKHVLHENLDTPCVLLDLERLEANISEMTRNAARAGVALRPHTKVHQSAWIAMRQVEAGACGIEVGTIGQAEIMAREGLHDIVVAHPFVGSRKLETLKRILSHPSNRLCLVVDMIEQARGIADVGRAVGHDIPLLLKVDTGGSPRYGVPPGEPAVKLALELTRMEGIHLVGIYGHEKGAKNTEEGLHSKAIEDASMMCDTARAIRKAGIEIDHVSVGASPTYRQTCSLLAEGQFPEITEIHPGNCVIGDIGYMMNGANTVESCAVTVLAAVMSVSHEAYAVLDVGVKTLGADSLIAKRDTPGFFWEGMPSYGFVRGRPDLWLGKLHAESSCIHYTDPHEKLELGERIEIVPNNATLVINLHSELQGIRDGMLECVVPVTGRGVGS